MAFGAPSLKGRALRLLAQREHSRAELERKLAKYEEDPGTLAQALDELQSRDFLNDTRVVQSVLHQRAGRLGAMRLRQELQQKGIDAQAIATAMDQLKGTELQRAREVWRRRFGELPSGAAERARQTRFLLARGFSGETVRRVLSLAEDEF